MCGWRWISIRRVFCEGCRSPSEAGARHFRGGRSSPDLGSLRRGYLGKDERVGQGAWRRTGCFGTEVWGPAPAPIVRVQGQRRVRLLVKAEKSVRLQAAVAEWLGQFRVPGNVRLAVDIDPDSFL
ncbi:hypothetical protein [Tabrizicola sp.]|uniref:hypothetical protein n=1 Tax=Tabrizicola sp. TaxID=2005166 RepID=UPI003F3D21B5